VGEVLIRTWQTRRQDAAKQRGRCPKKNRRQRTIFRRQTNIAKYTNQSGNRPWCHREVGSIEVGKSRSGAVESRPFLWGEA